MSEPQDGPFAGSELPLILADGRKTGFEESPDETQPSEGDQIIRMSVPKGEVVVEYSDITWEKCVKSGTFAEHRYASDRVPSGGWRGQPVRVNRP